MLGIKASEDALEQYNTMKLKKQTAFMIFKIEKNEIVVDVNMARDKCEDKDNYLGQFCKAVKESGQPRYAIVDWNHKLCFVAWVPSSGKPSLKMQYASVKEPFVQELVGIQIKLQATDDGELNEKVIEEKTKSKV